MQIITQELTISPLDSRAVHAPFHLHVIQIRRARTRLGENVGLTDIRVDVVWALAAVRTVLEFQGWE